MMSKIDHLGIAVRSIAEALKFFRDTLGLPLKGEEIVPDQRVRVAMLPLGDARIELLEATDEQSPIARFIARRGEGLHHVCIAVEDIEATLDRLKAAGVRLVDEVPRCGAGGHKIAFLHPSSTHGVLIELVEEHSSSSD
ncbi:MAG: methylmalonyl-CoA epimerase [Acidobacteria bacterium]|nr:MAG: methylmalonyl-CoA epimerase [Acidobacteriota bacterium]